MSMRITHLFSALHAQGFDLLQWTVLCRCVGLPSALGLLIGFVGHGTNRGKEIARHDGTDEN